MRLRGALGPAAVTVFCVLILEELTDLCTGGVALSQAPQPRRRSCCCLWTVLGAVTRWSGLIFVLVRPGGVGAVAWTGPGSPSAPALWRAGSPWPALRTLAGALRHGRAVRSHLLESPLWEGD